MICTGGLAEPQRREEEKLITTNLIVEESILAGSREGTGLGEHVAYSACLTCEQLAWRQRDAHVVAIIACSSAWSDPMYTVRCTRCCHHCWCPCFCDVLRLPPHSCQSYLAWFRVVVEELPCGNGRACQKPAMCWHDNVSMFQGGVLCSG